MLKKIPFQPGINKEGTQDSAEGSWWDCDRVRFRKGRPEKIGGWTQKTTNVTFPQEITPAHGTRADPDTGEITNNFRGVPRSLLDWGTAGSNLYIGIGTNLKFYTQSGDDLTDITPVRWSGTLASEPYDATTETRTTGVITPGDVTFEATSGSSTIVVSHSAHGAVEGDYVYFTGVDANGLGAGGNITQDVLQHEYEIDGLGDLTGSDGNNKYRIIARDRNNAVVVADVLDAGDGGSTTVAEYQINTGLNAYSSTSSGFGVGPFGDGLFSGGSGLSFSNSLRLWSQSDFGDDLIINPRGGPIYYWDESVGGRADHLDQLSGASNVPTVCRQVMVSPIDRHVIAFGVNSIGSNDLDPLLIRWSAQENAADWTPRTTNTAGGQVLSTGTQIIGAVRTRQEILVFTDQSIHAMRYTGSPFIFSFTPIAENVSMVGPNAAVSAGDAVYFMDNEGFYVYQGSIRKIPCTVLDYVFSNLNTSQLFKVFARNDPDNNEVTWYYPIGDSSTVTEPTNYVTFNYQEQVWTVGTMDRGCFSQASTQSYPIGGTSDATNVLTNKLFNHELGFDADGSEMNAYIESGTFSITEGDSFMFIRRFIPDFRYVTDTVASGFASLTFDLFKSDFGSYYQTVYRTDIETGNVSTPTAEVSVNITDQTPQKHIRFRGRGMSLKISDNGTGYSWTLGDLRFDMRTDGKRGGGPYK